MPKYQRSERQPVELDAEALACMLAGHPDTWIDPELWIAAHSVSAAYVYAQYSAARQRGWHPPVEEPSTPDPEPPSPPAGVGEQKFLDYIKSEVPEGMSIATLARKFNVSVVFARQACRAQGVRLPETLPRTTGKDS